MLVKLAFAMQRLKKYLKKIVMINKDGGGNFWILWGDTAVMRGDIELMGSPPVPPLGKTLTQLVVRYSETKTENLVQSLKFQFEGLNFSSES